MESVEIWKDIEGYEGKYQVSNTGKVKSLNYNNTVQHKTIKPKINKQGNLEVTLNKNNKHNYYMVNRLVIETFTDKKLTKNDIVMYYDQDRTNCNISNMYIITRGQRQEITYDTNSRSKIEVEYYGQKKSIKEVAKINNINPAQIRNRMSKLYWNVYEAAEIPVGTRKEEHK